MKKYIAYTAIIAFTAFKLLSVAEASVEQHQNSVDTYLTEIGV